MDSRKILEQFYLGDSKPQHPNKRKLPFFSGIVNTFADWPRYLLFGTLAITFWFIVHIYYYNKLVDLDYNAKAAWAQVEVQLQRRCYLQQNLTQVVLDYSKYEKDLLTQITRMRTSSIAENQTHKVKAEKGKNQPPYPTSDQSSVPPVKQMSQVDKLFSKIMVVAEQYPQLKLTENFQQFSEAIIDNENKIADRLMKYNEAVNIYTTILKQFPGNIFGDIAGFEPYNFYTPDKEVLKFKPVKY